MSWPPNQSSDTPDPDEILEGVAQAAIDAQEYLRTTPEPPRPVDPHMQAVEDFFASFNRPKFTADQLKPQTAKPDMHVFIDDSGCGGMKLDSGSSRHLVMAAAVFRDPKQIEGLKSRGEELQQRFGKAGEFKYNKTSKKMRSQYFEMIKDLTFAVRAIHMDKTRLTSDHLKSSASALKSFAIRELLTHTFGQIRNAKIVVDGEDLRAFEVEDREYLMGMANRAQSGTVHSVKFDDSKLNVGLQLADMIAGASHRHLRRENEHSSNHFSTFVHRTYQPAGSFWNYTK